MKMDEKEQNKDTFVSSHDGHYVKAGGNRSAGIRNSYEVWKDTNNNLYVKMNVLKNGVQFQTLFDYDDLDKIKENDITWYVLENGYIINASKKQYLHHLVMDFKGTGRGFQEKSIDHINRDKMDNRKANLRLATAKEQQQNSKGQIEGTKRERQHNAIKLPDNIEQIQIPKYVSYRKEKYKEYFVIEDHPVYVNAITINGKNIGKSIKSTQAQWIDQYAENKIAYPITSKLNEITIKCNKLDEIYKMYQETGNKDIEIEEDQVIKDLLEARIAKNTKKVYKYDSDFNLIDEYDSIVNAAKANNISDKTINRVKRTGVLCQGFYYRTEPIESDT